MNSKEFMHNVVIPSLMAHPNVERVREFGIMTRGWHVFLVTGEQFELTPEKVGRSHAEREAEYNRHHQVGPEAGFQPEQ